MGVCVHVCFCFGSAGVPAGWAGTGGVRYLMHWKGVCRVLGASKWMNETLGILRRSHPPPRSPVPPRRWGLTHL